MIRIAALIAAASLAAMSTGVAAETCQKSGEDKGAFGTTCYYQCTFGEKAENIGAGRLCPLTTQASASSLARPPAPSGGVCFKQGERTTGMSKQCIYDCTGRENVVTVGAVQLCPLTVR